MDYTSFSEAEEQRVLKYKPILAEILTKIPRKWLKSAKNRQNRALDFSENYYMNAVHDKHLSTGGHTYFHVFFRF